MTDRDQQDAPDDPAVRASADAFLPAATAASEGFKTLYVWARAWFRRRHSAVRSLVAVSIWFAGNWTYNRIAPTIFETFRSLLRRVSVDGAVAPAFGTLAERPTVASVPVLLVLLVIVVVQNRAQTRKLKSIESKVTTMSESPKTSPNGGTRGLPPTGPRAIGGAIVGAIVGAVVGIWLGPGSVPAGMFLGFTIGDRWDIRAYERDPLTPDLNIEPGPEE